MIRLYELIKHKIMTDSLVSETEKVYFLSLVMEAIAEHEQGGVDKLACKVANLNAAIDAMNSVCN